MPRKPKNRKPSLYQEVSKRFTAYNNSLPDAQKLSYPRRRQLIKQSILPALSTTPRYKIKARDIKGLILQQFALIPVRDPNVCNLNLISPSQYQEINWYEIDDFLQKRLPDCIWVRVNAGEFGQTNIFNTRNYNYYNIGVRQITENIRKEVKNLSGAYYKGVQKLRPKKKNDGEADSYYLDLILHIVIGRDRMGQPVTEVGQRVRYVSENPMERIEMRRASNRVNSQLDTLFNNLAREKGRKSRAFRQMKKDKAILNKLATKKTRTEAAAIKNTDAFIRKYKTALLKIDRYLSKGLINKARYDMQKADLEKALDLSLK